MIHFPIQQHLAGFRDQAARPNHNQAGAGNPHDGIKPGPAIQPATRQGDDGESGGRGIRNDMKISGFQVQVLMMMPVIIGVRLLIMMMRAAKNAGARQVHHQADDGNQHGFPIKNGLWRQQPLA